jgi:hypothetical protein
MSFKHNIGGGQKSNRRSSFRLGDRIDERIYDETKTRTRYAEQAYVPQFEFELVHENSVGRVVEVLDTKTDQCTYMAHKWTRPDKRAFRVVGKAISLGDARALLRSREVARANATAA